MNIMRVQGKGFDHKPRICKYTELEPALSGADFLLQFVREVSRLDAAMNMWFWIWAWWGRKPLDPAGLYTPCAMYRYAADGPCGCQGLS